MAVGDVYKNGVRTSGTGAIYTVADPTSVMPIVVTTPGMGALAQYAQVTGYGTSRTSIEPSTSFFDVFDGSTIDVSKWTAAGSNPPTQGSGVATLSLAGTNSLSSTLISNPKFSPTLGFNVLGAVMTLDAAKQATPNCHRFFGVGQVTAYATATPLTDGVGFEVDLTGEFNCVIYVAGTRFVINSTSNALVTSSAGTGGAGTATPAGTTPTTYGQVMAWPTNATRVAIIIRADTIFWYAGSLDIPVAAASLITRPVIGLPIRAAAITTAAVSTVLSTVFTLSALAMGDSSAQGHTLMPSAAQSNSPVSATTTVYATSLICKASPGTCYGISGYNSKASTQFIQLHDSATLPADTAVPAVIITVPATSNFSIDFGVYGRRCLNGITLSNSSTGPTKTIGSADCWFDARFA